jgi:probable biosynthetic protein (TIGR04098 family)
VKKALPSELLGLPPGERAELAAALWDSLREEDLEHALRALIADVTQRAAETIDLRAGLREQGIDSLQLIILRERLEATLGLFFTDAAWTSVDSPVAILAHAGDRARRRAGPSPGSALPSINGSTKVVESSASAPFRDDLEIGMPLTGRNNLAETPLLQYLGDLRWRQISDVMGVPTREIRDEDGERLYATFFYVEIAFPVSRPMSSFGENDRFEVISTIGRYGTSMVDGLTYLVPMTPGASSAPSRDAGRAWTPGLDEAMAAGIPAVRLSNIFVKQFGGAEWLKKGRPAHDGFTRIVELRDAPDSYTLTTQAEQAGSFAAPDAPWIPMTDGMVAREYRLIPDRDLNGAGLVYFANYPMFLDICERDVLSSARIALPADAIDRRTLVRRRSAYLNNASSRDTLRIEIAPSLRVIPVAGAGGDRDLLDVHLHADCRMRRISDNRLMMVSSVQKIIPAVAAGALRFVDTSDGGV